MVNPACITFEFQLLLQVIQVPRSCRHTLAIETVCYQCRISPMLQQVDCLLLELSLWQPIFMVLLVQFWSMWVIVTRDGLLDHILMTDVVK